MKRLNIKIIFLFTFALLSKYNVRAYDFDEAYLNLYDQQYTYVSTPLGKSILVYVNNELSPSEIAQYAQDCVSIFPNVVILSQASFLYNCHNYAWNPSNKYWMDSVKPYTKTANLSKYWNNDAYEETTSLKYDKIVYYSSSDTSDINITHSAVISNVSGYYESKWGKWPLVRHLPDDVPLSYGTDKRFFKPIAPTRIEDLLTCSNGNGPISLNTSAYYIAPVSNEILAKTSLIKYQVVSPKGEDAVEEGLAIINSKNDYGFNVTFTRIGIYEMSILYYNKYSELLATYSFEPIVSL